MSEQKKEEVKTTTQTTDTQSKDAPKIQPVEAKKS
jgi:hypothetical protein